MKVSSGQGPPSCQKTFPEAGLLFRRRFCGQGPPSFKKDHRFITFRGGREYNPDEGFQRPRPTFLSKDLSKGRDCYSDEGFAAKAHLLLKRPPFYYVFISGRVHIPMKVSWPMPTFLTNKTTYTRGPRLLSRLRFQAVMAHLIFLPLRRGGFLNPWWIGALCPPSLCNEV